MILKSLTIEILAYGMCAQWRIESHKKAFVAKNKDKKSLETQYSKRH